MKYVWLLILGVASGGLIALQNVLNAELGKRTGNFGSVFLLSLISLVTLVALLLLFPKTANLRNAPGIAEWHLYVGGVMGVAIMAAPIFLLPRIGATATLTAVVVGQMVLAIVVDHFGIFGAPVDPVTPAKLFGVVLLIVGVFFASR
jgi:transporter family-2 protein